MESALDLYRLEGKVAVVTGGSKGIGMYYCQALCDAGARVVVADIDPETVQTTTSRLNQEREGSALAAELDVTSRESVRSMVQKIDAHWGRLDILVNNAGLYAVLPIRQMPWEIPEDEFDRVMAVNVRGIYVTTVECLPLMQRNRWGRVINISSSLAFKASPALMHYAASKGAVVNLTRSMAQVLGEAGITVNAIAPGGTASPTVLEQRPSSAGASPSLQRRAIKRVEIPEDLVGTLLFLASRASDFLTGQTIVVDGGDVLH